MKTLCSLQSEAITALLAAPQNGPRAASYGRSVLNRRPRVVGRIRRTLEAELAKLGWVGYKFEAFVDTAWQDVVAQAKLEDAADQ